MYRYNPHSTETESTRYKQNPKDTTKNKHERQVERLDNAMKSRETACTINKHTHAGRVITRIR